MTSVKKDISAVIVTYNRAELVGATLSTYLDEPEIMEVIVVDDASGDDTPAVLAEWARRDPRIVVVRHAVNLGLPRTINSGMALARGAFIFHGEDDVRVESGFFSTLKSHMETAGADLIASRRIWVAPWEKMEEARRRADAKPGPLWRRDSQDLGDPEIETPGDMDVPIVASNFLMRREVFEAVKFDENLRGYPYRIESDFSLSAKERGFRLAFCPHAVSCHFETRSFIGRRRRSWFALNGWIIKNHHRFLTKHRASLGPLLGLTRPIPVLMAAFVADRIRGQLRSAVHSARLAITGERARRLWAAAAKNSDRPRVALLWPASYGDVRGGTELMGAELLRAFPGSEMITVSDCAEDLLARIRFPWFGIDVFLKAIAVGRRFWKLHRRRPFDAVIAQGMYGAWLSLFRPKIPVIDSYTGTMIGIVEAVATKDWRFRAGGYAASFFEMLGGLRKDRRAAVSEKTKDEIGKYYRMDAIVIPLGVDMDLFRPGDKAAERRRTGLPEGKTVALFVGRPEYAKGIDILDAVAARFPGVEFVAISPKPFDSHRANVAVRADIPDEEVAALYRAADILFFPSRAESCLCYTLIEAMAADLPVIAGRRVLHSLPAGVGPAAIGIAVEEETPEGFAGALQSFLERPFAVRAREIVENNFSRELFARRFRDILKDSFEKRTGKS